MSSAKYPDDFLIEQHGDVTVIVPSNILETFDPGLIDSVSELMLGPIRDQDNPLVVVDLINVDFFGSSFLSLLLRCWKLSTVKGGQMVLTGVSDRARELLHITSLDMIWPIYSDRHEAMEALEVD